MFVSDSNYKFDISKFISWSLLLGLVILILRLIFGVGISRMFYFEQDYLIILNLIIFIYIENNQSKFPKRDLGFSIILFLTGFLENYDSSIKNISSPFFYLFDIPCLIYFIYHLIRLVDKFEYKALSNDNFVERKKIKLLWIIFDMIYNLIIRLILVYVIYGSVSYIIFYKK
jgi:hypothetical protein